MNHEWVKGGTSFFGAMGGVLHFKMCANCGVRISVPLDEYELLPEKGEEHEAE